MALVLAEKVRAGDNLNSVLAMTCPGAEVLRFGHSGLERGMLVRRLFLEMRAEAYALVFGEVEPLSVARAVAAVAEDGRDLAVVTALRDPEGAGITEQLLDRSLAYLFGCGAEILSPRAVVCSRRLALTYAGAGTGADLVLHGLRNRVSRVEILSPGEVSLPTARRDLADRFGQARLVARLFAEERPRRSFGLVGLATLGAGCVSAMPAVSTQGWHGAAGAVVASAPALFLAAAGLGLMSAGALLDALTKARQDVTRLGLATVTLEGVAAGRDQSSVS